MIPTILILAQLGNCLGNQSPACRLERQLEEQERQQRLRHEDLLRQRQQPPPSTLYPSIQFPRIEGPIR